MSTHFANIDRLAHSMEFVSALYGATPNAPVPVELNGGGVPFLHGAKKHAEADLYRPAAADARGRTSIRLKRISHSG